VGEEQVQEGVHSLIDVDPVIHAPARLTVLTYLYVVASADYVFLKNMTGLSWGNLSTHLSKLEAAGYVALEKGFKGRKPHTMVRLTEDGRSAFRAYKVRLKQILDDLPD